MAIIATSRTAGFFGATNVSGYLNWSSFMNSYAISFTTSTAGLQSRTDTASVNVDFPADGTYTVTCAADNAAFSSMTVDGNSCGVGALQTGGFTTDITVTAGTKNITITIGNQDTGVPLAGFADNPMGLAFTIAEKRIKGPDENVTILAGPRPDLGSWTPPIPTCGSAPTLSSTSGGLQIRKSGSSSVILNLKNYANKLVTLKVVHQKSAAWQNGFSFDIPNASDITAGGSPLGGSEYDRDAYNNPDISGTTTFYLYNLDGGDYDYTFSHSSVPEDPVFTRTNYEKVCNPNTEIVEEQTDDSVFVEKKVTTTTCTWVAFTETYSEAWPLCPVGVALAKNGGNEVRWCYEDGGGAPFCDQTVTITVVDVRDIIPQSGGICMSDIKDRVWIADPGDGTANGNCLSEYRDHSTALSQNRYRNPSSKSSKTTLPDSLCFTDFRGIAGAKTPGDMGIP